MTAIARPTRATEYGIAELIDGTWRHLPQCGSWYSDRYSADNLTGRDAAQAALTRVAEQVPGTYRVELLRTFTRPAGAGLADALPEAELREWLRVRCAPADLDSWVDELLGRSQAQLDAEYAALHGEIA